MMVVIDVIVWVAKCLLVVVAVVFLDFSLQKKGFKIKGRRTKDVLSVGF